MTVMTTMKVLVPVDGSANAMRAVRHAVAEYRHCQGVELHLLSVLPRLSRYVARFVSRHDREAWLAERAAAATRGVVAVLAQAGMFCHTHWAAGDRAKEICAAARRLGVQRIVLGVERKPAVTRWLEDPVTDRVLDATPVPIDLVVGDTVPAWHRWRLPVGVLGGGGLMLAMLD